MCFIESLLLYLPESSVSTVAVCAGSGASVLNGVRADLYITGENLVVVICEHLILLDFIMRVEVIVISPV